MADANRGQPPVDVAPHSLPRPPVSLAPAPKRPAPDPGHAMTKRRHRPIVAGHTVVAVVPVEDRCQVGALFGYRVVHASPQLGCHLVQLRLPASALRLPHQRVLSTPGAPTDVREPEEVEGAGLHTPSRTPSSRGL